MEKIQSAIAKARAARTEAGHPHTARSAAPVMARATGTTQGTTPGTGPGTGPDAASPQHALPPDSQLWEALPIAPLRDKHLAANRIAAYVGGPGSTEFDILRTRLLQQVEPQGWRRIAVTSPDPSCGKSTVAANLAFSLARQEGQRVLLVELDLRRPSLARILGVKPAHGIGALLTGEAEPEACVLRLGRNLAVVPANGPSRNPAELLRSPGTIAALADLEARLAPTIVLFDLPPILANDDAMAFVGRTDAALLVAASEATTIKQIDQCERDLAAQTNVLGIVLNKCRYMDRDIGYGYEYD